MRELPALEASAIVERAEVEAWWSLCTAVPAESAAALGLTVERRGEAVLSTCRMFDGPLGNRLVGAGLSRPCEEGVVEDAVAHFRRLGIRNYALQFSPYAQPQAISGWLQRHGLERGSRWAKVLRDAAPLPRVETPYEIRRVGREQAAAFGATAAAGFGRPPIVARWMGATVGHPRWHHYLAYDGETPVAAGALFVAGEVGWLGIGATLPGYRQRGAQGALMCRRIADGIALGCRWLVAETNEDLPQAPNPSYRNMLRTGFRLVYQRDNYGERRGA